MAINGWVIVGTVSALVGTACAIIGLTIASAKSYGLLQAILAKLQANDEAQENRMTAHEDRDNERFHTHDARFDRIDDRLRAGAK